jgi:hypothetical protein
MAAPPSRPKGPPKGRGSIQRHGRPSVAAKSPPLNSKGAFHGRGERVCVLLIKTPALSVRAERYKPA